MRLSDTISINRLLKSVSSSVRFVKIQITVIYIVDKQSIGKLIPLIEVDRPDHRFESIPVDMFLVGASGRVGDHVPVQPDLRAIVLSDWRETIFERNCVRNPSCRVGKLR